METVLSIIAIVISSVSLFFNAYPVYCKYMRKKEKTIMTITDGKVENNIIRLCVVYSNAISIKDFFLLQNYSNKKGGLLHFS